MKIATIFAIMVFTFFTQHALSQQAPANQTTTKTVKPSLNDSKSEISTTEAILRAQIQVMKDYDQRITSTIYWSLGIVGGIAILLTGFSWYTNFRVFEREKDAIARQLQAGLSERVETIETTITTRNESILNSLRESIDARFEAHTTTLNAKTSTIDTKLSRLEAKFEQRHLDLEYKISKAEADQWEKQGVWTNCARAWLECAKISKKLSNSYRLANALDNLKKTIQTRKTTPPNLDSEDIADIVSFIDSLNSEYAVTVGAIKELLKHL